ncbi:LysR family transcriptional regulator [Chondromyces crocatus]|uniref:LysR family transcriptional regulator n=1 Tax=Chondromyces crocatus TaxID=52 RepID=A0A0K1EKP8_CHOCO|nr:LysR family transcriptional regulator [Chondromyces crocatus]AKT41178.1 LysR family transcriptional regulator [Chondromyces crocatus]
MAHREINRSGDMTVFVRVVELGSFSAAARALRMTPSAVSKMVGRLETRLGVRLFNRSTRHVQLTPEGTVYFERSARILADIDAAEREISPGLTPRGRLRVNANVPFGVHCLLPRIPAFLAAHPHITLDLALTDTVVDLFEAHADVAIRLGHLAESRLVARKLGESRMVVVASRAYLEHHGQPRKPADLAKHNCLGFCFARHTKGWPFRDRARKTSLFLPTGNTLVSDGEAMRRLALAGLGIARLGAFQVQPDIDTGAFVPLLEAHNPGDTLAAHAVFLGHDGKMPARVRAFLDYLVANVRLS